MILRELNFLLDVFLFVFFFKKKCTSVDAVPCLRSVIFLGPEVYRMNIWNIFEYLEFI